jgi:hypothetical protein
MDCVAMGHSEPASGVSWLPTSRSGRAPERYATAEARRRLISLDVTLRVIGAGLPRTGTRSLKAALERLLGGSCYHMAELRVEHAGAWRDAIDGRTPDWDEVLAGYMAAVDWPASWMWRELADAFPEAVVLLSHRDSAATWYTSVENTVMQPMVRIAKFADPQHVAAGEEWRPQWRDAKPEHLVALGELFSRLASRIAGDRGTAMAFYESHLAEVRATIPSRRLLEWQPTDGWEPLCAALDLPVPDEPFPHENSTEVSKALAAEAMGLVELGAAEPRF